MSSTKYSLNITYIHSGEVVAKLNKLELKKINWKETNTSRVNQFRFKWLGFVYQTDEFQHCPPGFLYLIALSMVIKEVQADEAVLSKRQYQDGKIILFCKIYQSLTTTVVQIVLLSESTLISPDEDLQYAVETSRSISRWIMRQTMNELLISFKLFLFLSCENSDNQ